MTDEERLKEGLAVRRAVLGDDHVERARNGLTAFDQEFDDMLTEWAWGSVWTRPGLERKTRSLLNIALLAALDRQRELGLHIQGALRTGCTEDEIKEVLLHCTAYLGVPAGIAAFKTAKEALVATAGDGQPDQKKAGQPDQKKDGQTTD